MTPKAFLIACGWVVGAGGQYYFPSDGHPHLHLGTTGVGMEIGDIGSNVSYLNKRAAYTALVPKIRFIAISSGTRAVNFIQDALPTIHIGSAAAKLREVCGNEAERTVSIGYELDYLLRAYGRTL